MKRTAAVIIVALGMAACSSCSSGDSKDGGTSGGSCKNVVVCTVITLAQVNAATNKMLTATTPMQDTGSGTGGNTQDSCNYGGSVELNRLCFTSSGTASTSFDSDKAASLAAMGTRSDVPGLGDKAFYQSEPSGSGVATTKVRLEASQGGIVVIATATGVAPADDATVKAGLTGFVKTLLQ